MTFDDSRLTLKEANPNIIFFCDRPVRTAGHMNRDAFDETGHRGGKLLCRQSPQCSRFDSECQRRSYRSCRNPEQKTSGKRKRHGFPDQGDRRRLRTRERPSSCSSTPLGGPCLQPRLREFIAGTGGELCAITIEIRCSGIPKPMN